METLKEESGARMVSKDWLEEKVSISRSWPWDWGWGWGCPQCCWCCTCPTWSPPSSSCPATLSSPAPTTATAFLSATSLDASFTGVALSCIHLVVVFVISPHIPDASTYMISSCDHICHSLVLTHTYIKYDCRQINFGRRPFLSIFPLPRCLNYVDSSLSHCQLSSSGPPCDQGDIKIQNKERL